MNALLPHRLETTRLLLRPFEAEDLDPYASMCADPEVMRYVGDRGVLSREDAWRQMALLAGHWLLRGFGMWAVEERESGTFVGRVGLHYPEGWPDRKVAWALARPFWDRGCQRGGQSFSEYSLRPAGLALRNQPHRPLEHQIGSAGPTAGRTPNR